MNFLIVKIVRYFMLNYELQVLFYFCGTETCIDVSILLFFLDLHLELLTLFCQISDKLLVCIFVSIF